MPVKRRTAKQRPQVPVEYWRLLNDEPLAEGDSPFRSISFANVAQVLWKAHHEEILARWSVKHRGTRPSCWWRFDAPTDARHRVGGVGVPGEDPLCDERRFPMFWKSVDAKNPPLFESEAAYLKRLGLLFPGEARRIRKEDLDPAPLPRMHWPYELQQKEDLK